MGRTQPHGISAYHAARVLLILEVRPAYVSHSLPGLPVKHGQNGLAEPLRAEMWRGRDFGGYVPYVLLMILWLWPFSVDWRRACGRSST